MKNKIKLILAASLLSFAAASAQTGGVGVGTTTPDASSALDVTSTTKGFLMPRMTTTERTAITSPATGLQVFDTTTNSPWFFNGTAWVNTTASGQKWIDGATAGDIELVNPTGTETIKFTDKGFKEISKTLTTIPTLSGASYLNNPITDYNMYNHKYYKSSEIPLNPATSNIAFVQNMALIDGSDTRTATSNILTENALTIDPTNSTTYSSATANFNKLLHYGTGFTTNLFADANYTRLGYGGTATHIYGSHSTVDFRGAGTTTNHVGVYSSPQINNASGTITNVIGYRTYLAFGSSSTNISNLFINNADYGGVGASYTGTITNSYDFYANNFNPTAATVTNKFGIYSNGIDKNNSLLGNLLVGNSANSATAKADASAQLEVKSTTKGFLMPRMTTVQRTAIATPATGLQVYDTDTNTQWYYNGTAWVQGGTTASSSKWTNDATNTRVALTNLSDGVTARPAGTEFAIKDNGAIGIGTATPNTDALLEMNTTNKGLLLPRVQLTSLTSPAPLAAFTPGMVVYCIGNAGTAPNNVTAGFYIASSTSWTRTTMSLGDRGDITITGDMQTPTFTIDNGVVASEKLASSLKVGGGAPTNTSVALEVTGGNKGFVVSTTSSLANILNPVVGMMVYSTTENCLRIYTATGWSNCLLAATGDASTGGSGVASTYGAGGNRSITPVYGKRVSGLTTTSSATVGTAGSYNIIASSATLPGLIFTATGTFAGTGAQTVTLTAVGAIDSAYAGATHTFTSNTTPSFTFTVTVAAMTYVTGAGSTFNAFYNGHVDNVYTGTTTTVIHTAGETFSSNANCTAKTISQTSPANCPASVTGTSGTVYPLVWINGQCWMQTNLKEVPTNFPDAPNTGNNIWLNTTIADTGKWGYYNTTTTDGTAGWGTTEPAAGEGILYQWSAAMNNATAERAQGACPTGFHIPSDCEWTYLENGLGMSLSEQNLIFLWRSNSSDNQGTPGYKLRSQGTGQNNASGFSGLLSGGRAIDGTYFFRGSGGLWWSSTATTASTANRRYIHTGYRGVSRSNSPMAEVFSVRCLKN